jgi:hypothetical protein
MSLVSALVSIALIVASKDANVGHRDARSAVLARLKFRASAKQKSGVLMQKLQDQNSLLAALDASLSARPVPAPIDSIVPVNRRLMGVSAEAVTLQQRCEDWKVFGLGDSYNNYGSDNGGWREHTNRKRLPDGVQPRRSLRLCK